MMAAGFILGRLKKITEPGIKQMTTVLLWIVTPCVIINAFISYTYTPERMFSILWVALCALIMHTAGITLSMLFFKNQQKSTRSVLRFGTIFSNCGFMSIPLAGAIFGESGIFYVSVFVVIFNLFTWTVGVAVYGQRLNFKKAFLNPGVIGFALALPIFFLKIKIPAVIAGPIGYFADLNSPLAMIVTGAILSSADLKLSSKDLKFFGVCALRLVAVPIITAAVMLLLKMPKELLCIAILPSCAPTASNTSLFAVMFSSDSASAGKLVAISNLLCIITIPLIFASVSVL